MESSSKHTLMPYHNSYILFTKVNFGLVSTFVEGMGCPTVCLAVKGELGLKHLRQTQVAKQVSFTACYLGKL